MDYCHGRGVRVYLTLNTLLFDRELEAAGFCTCDGRVSRRYFDKRYGLEAMA